MSVAKKDCLKWLLNNYNNADFMDTPEYKEYETECATKENIKDIENLHIYFNDSNLIRSIYKQMSKDYDFCFLKEIEVSGSSDDIKFKIYSSKKNKLNDFDKQQYIDSEVSLCKNTTFAIPFSVPQHANMLIINATNKTVEHFEPNGVLEGDIGELLIAAAMKLKEELFPDYTYIPVISFCPETGIQMELARRFPHSNFLGSCAIWSMWYAFLRLSNPGLDQKSIYEYSIQTEDLDNLNDFLIYLINAFLSKVNITRDEEGRPISVDGKEIYRDRIDYDNGDVYEGQTISIDTGGKKTFIPFGIGKLFIATMNEIYQGTFLYGDIIEGSRLDVNTGETYEGHFLNGEPSGLGTLTNDDGVILYEGIWENGVAVHTDDRKRHHKYKLKTKSKKKKTKGGKQKKKGGKRKTKHMKHR